MSENKISQGIKLVLLSAFISGAANFLHKEMIRGGLDPILLTAVKNSIVGLLFIGLLIFSFKQLKKIKFKDFWKLLLISVIGGCLPFILFFKGLALTSAVNGSFIHKTMFIWVAILAIVFLKEKIGKHQLLALGILSASLFIMVKLTNFSLNKGDLMIFIATLLWAGEIIIVKKFIQNIDYRILATARMALGSIFILAIAFFSNKLGTIATITPLDWLKIATVSLFLFIFVYAWYRSLTLLPAGLVTSVLTLAFPVTIILTNLKATRPFSFLEIIGIALAIYGVYHLIKSFKKTKLWLQLKKN